MQGDLCIPGPTLRFDAAQRSAFPAGIPGASDVGAGPPAGWSGTSGLATCSAFRGISTQMCVTAVAAGAHPPSDVPGRLSPSLPPCCLQAQCEGLAGQEMEVLGEGGMRGGEERKEPQAGSWGARWGQGMRPDGDSDGP